MSTLLHVIASPRGDKSESRALSTTFVDAYAASHPDATIDTLDLWADPVPTFDGSRVEGKMAVLGGEEPTGLVGAAWTDLVATVERFTAADLYVFSVPMWNSSIPWILKHYIDTLTQPGLTFGIDMSEGYFGLLEAKTAVTIYTSGIFVDGVSADWGKDHQSTYFRDWLEFIGILDNHEIRFQPTIFPTGGAVEERRVLAHDRARALAAKL